MFSLLRNRFGIPGVISVIALVFAMIGGAYAATNESGKATASAKAKKGPRGPKGKAGPAGPQGPAGPAGTPGPPGPKGSNGSNGDAGARGATGASGATGEDGATGATGQDGSPWTAGGTLPSGQTETGAWSFVIGPEEPTFGVPFGKAAISFPIPIANPGGNASIAAHRLVQGESETAECPGTYIEPKAEPGNLCVYTHVELNAGPSPQLTVDLPSITFEAEIIPGAFVNTTEGESGGFAQGSWAVTAP